MFCNKCGRQLPDGAVCPCQQPQQPQQDPMAYQAPPQPQYQPQPAPQYPPQPQPSYRAPKPASNVLAKFTVDKVVAIFVMVLTFGLHFINWYGCEAKRVNFGPYGVDSRMDGGLGDYSWLFVVVMILCIINIIVFVAYLVSSTLNISAMVPALMGKDLSKTLYKVFYIILILALVLGFIGGLVGYKIDTEDEFFGYDIDESYTTYEEFETAVEEGVIEYYTEYYTESYYDYSKSEAKKMAEKRAEEFMDDKDNQEYLEEAWEEMYTETSIGAGWWVTMVFALLGLVFVIKPNLISTLSNNAKAANTAYQQPYYPQQY